MSKLNSTGNFDDLEEQYPQTNSSTSAADEQLRMCRNIDKAWKLMFCMGGRLSDKTVAEQCDLSEYVVGVIRTNARLVLWQWNVQYGLPDVADRIVVLEQVQRGPKLQSVVADAAERGRILVGVHDDPMKLGVWIAAIVRSGAVKERQWYVVSRDLWERRKANVACNSVDTVGFTWGRKPGTPPPPRGRPRVNRM